MTITNSKYGTNAHKVAHRIYPINTPVQFKNSHWFPYNQYLIVDESLVAAPHLPHAWECGYVTEESTRTLLCGDLFTQGGTGLPSIAELDILAPSEAFRQQMDYFCHSKNTRMYAR